MENMYTVGGDRESSRRNGAPSPLAVAQTYVMCPQFIRAPFLPIVKMGKSGNVMFLSLRNDFSL